jgi:anti-sigma B factor antagonist
MPDPSKPVYTHDLKIDLDTHGEVTVAAIVGNVDTVTADELLATFESALAEERIRLVGDLSGVGYLSSAGLRALLGTMKDARRRGGDLRLAAVGDKVLKVLQLSGFTSILRLYDDVDAAVASYAD